MNKLHLFPSRLRRSPMIPPRSPSCWSRWPGAVPPSAVRFMTRPRMAHLRKVMALLKDNPKSGFQQETRRVRRLCTRRARGPQGRGGIAAGQQGRSQCQGQQRRDTFALGGGIWPQGRGGIATGQQAEVNAKDNNGRTPLHSAAQGVTRAWRNCCWPTGPRSMPRTTTAGRLCTMRWLMATRKRRNCCDSTAATNRLLRTAYGADEDSLIVEPCGGIE